MNRLPALIAVAAGLLLGTATLGGYDLLVEPLEARFLFSPWPADRDRLQAIASPRERLEDVRLTMPDGVALHGWLKRPAVRPGQRYPLVIVYGGIRREVSEFVQHTAVA